jgi:hypothetical protein
LFSNWRLAATAAPLFPLLYFYYFSCLCKIAVL